MKQNFIKNTFGRRKPLEVLWYFSPEEYYLLFRRWFYYYFREKEMLERIKNRKGECKPGYECAHLCCNYLTCSYFNKEKKLCNCYEDKPLNCKLFPFDEKDLPRNLKFFCRYYW